MSPYEDIDLVAVAANAANLHTEIEVLKRKVGRLENRAVAVLYELKRRSETQAA